MQITYQWQITYSVPGDPVQVTLASLLEHEQPLHSFTENSELRRLYSVLPSLKKFQNPSQSDGWFKE